MTYDEYRKKHEQEGLKTAGSVSLAETTGNSQREQNQQENQQNQQQSQQTQGFANPYQGNLDELYDQVMNWGNDFSYDVMNDPVYQQYAQQYAQQGRNAMLDTVGNASGMTGGYGNSWAATAGNQAYQAYMQQLANKVPELYESAWGRYMQEGENLLNQLNVTANLHGNAQNEYWNQQSFNTEQQQNAFSQATYLMDMGITPSAELMALAGLTAEQVEEYMKRKRGSGNQNKPTVISLPLAPLTATGIGGLVSSYFSGNPNWASGSDALTYEEYRKKNNRVNWGQE